MKRVWQMLKKYPEIAGIIFIGLLAGGVLFYRHYHRTELLQTTVRSQELEREATIEGFKRPEDTIEYMLTAIEKNDLDMALRACPIDEKGLGIDIARIIDEEEVFSVDLTYMPSWWREYFPVTSAELTSDYVTMFEEMQELLKGKEVQVEAVHAASPEKQLTSEYQLGMRDICDQWAAEAVIEMAVELEIDGQSYLMGATLFRYYSYWRIDTFSSELLGLADGELKPITPEEYESLTDERQEKKLLKSFDKDKKDYKEEKNVKNPGKQMLPPNYFVVNSASADTPEALIEKFTLYLQKADLTSVMNYAVIAQKEEDLQHVSATVLKRQGDFAQQLQSFYYYLLGSDFVKEGTQSLEKMGMTGSSIGNSFNPGDVPYMDLLGTADMGDGEYIAVYYYGGEHYLAGFTVEETEAGWKIKSLTCEKEDLVNGQLRQITEKEYHSLIK